MSKETYSKPRIYSRYTLAGLAFLMLAFPVVNSAAELMRYNLHTDQFQGLNLENPIAILFSDFSYLPLGLLLVSTCTDRQLPYRHWLLAFCIAVPPLFAALQIYLAHGIEAVDWAPKVVAYALYMIGVVLLAIGARRPELTANRLPSSLVQLGSISYGVYLIHFLLIVLLGRIPYLQGTTTSFLARILLTLVLTLGAGYLLEKIWHPFAMQHLKRLRFFQ